MIDELVFVTPSWWLGLSHHQHLIQRGVDLGYRVTVYATDPRDPSIADEVPASVVLERLPFNREDFRLAPAALTAWQAAWLVRRHPNAVFTVFTVLQSLMTGMPIWAAGGRVVFVLCGLGHAFHSPGRVWSTVRRGVMAVWGPAFRSDRATVVTHNRFDRDLVTDALGLPAGKVTAVGGAGANASLFPHAPPPDNEVPVILCPGRKLRNKGFFEAVEASALLDAWGVPHEMWFSNRADPGNPAAITQEELDEAAATHPSVRVLPYHDDVASLYRAADIVCVPTYYGEGLPTTLLEASATGRPIVSTQWRGVVDAIDDGDNGLLVPPREARPLAEALARLLRDVDLRHALGRRAFEVYTQRFTKEANLVDHNPAFVPLGVDLLAAVPG